MLDGGLVEYGTWSDGRVAVGFGVPTSALNGEEPKYANKFVDQITFKRSESGILAREVCAAAMPVLAAITAGTPDAGTILWLDPTPLIEEARDDAASARGTMAAAVGGTPATLAERVNEVVARAEAGLFADAEMLVMGDPGDRDRMAETMALNAVAAARDLAALLDAPDVADGVRREAQDAALAALAESLAELDGGALAAAIGVPTIVRRIIDRVKRAVFGEPTSPAADDAPNLAPIIDRVGISPYLTAALPGVEQVWVYGLPSLAGEPVCSAHAQRRRGRIEAGRLLRPGARRVAVLPRRSQRLPVLHDLEGGVMRYTREMFTLAAATARGTDRIYADPATGAITGMVARWGMCLRGTGAAVCRTLTPDSTDVDAFREAGGLVTLDDEDGGVIAAGSLAHGPPHPATSRLDGEALVFELARPENLAARVVPHLTPEGVAIAGAVSPEGIERWGSVAAAAEAINRAAWSIHAGPSQDNPGKTELWGIVAVNQSGFRQRIPQFALARGV
jgi:hypothetical protein